MASMDGGVVERPVRVHRPGGVVPGVLWLPAGASAPPPLVLLGHGGSGHKRSPRVLDHARWFAAAGLASYAIDGPYHGERVTRPLAAAEYQKLMVGAGLGRVLDGMVGDWAAGVAALAAEGVVDGDRLGYLGLSLGTRFGLPVAAELGDRLRCAVFGKFGLRQCAAMDPGLDAPERVAADARRVTAPLLFHVQWQDEIFPRDGQLDLFDTLGSADRTLLAHTGTHAQTRPAASTAWRRFVADHLAAGA